MNVQESRSAERRGGGGLLGVAILTLAAIVVLSLVA